MPSTTGWIWSRSYATGRNTTNCSGASSSRPKTPPGSTCESTYVALVQRMECDLDTKLQWIAIDHHNTDDAHVHLLVRGVRDDGRSLQIDREYLKLGMRARSQEIATRELGLRLEPEVLQARERVIGKEQWTEIDRSLQRKANGSGLVSYEHFQPRSDVARVSAEQEVARLRFLEGMGLARRVGEASWELAQEHERSLRQRQQSKDIIKSRARGQRRNLDQGLDRGFDWRRDRNG